MGFFLLVSTSMPDYDDDDDDDDDEEEEEEEEEQQQQQKQLQNTLITHIANPNPPNSLAV